MPPFRAHLLAFPWDVEDTGIDDALDLVQGSLGASGITIPLDPPPLLMLRARAADAPRTYRATGGLWFHPDPRRYEVTRLKPIISHEMRSRDPFARLTAACAARNLALRVRLSGTFHPLAARRHPEMVTKDVFGRHDDERLCPLNPDVAEYLAALIADLSAAHALDALEIVWPAFRPPAEATDGLLLGVEPGPAERFLLNLCFCESCLQRARADDVEVELVARHARESLDRFLAAAQPVADSLPALLAAHPLLRRFHDWREQQAAALIARLAREAAAPLVVDERSLVGRALQEPPATGQAVDAAPSAADPAQPGLFPASNAADPLPGPDRVLVRVETPEPDAVSVAVARGRRCCTDPTGVEIELPCAPQILRTPATLTPTLLAAIDQSVRTVTLAQLGLLAAPALETIRQALRHARRTAESLC